MATHRHNIHRNLHHKAIGFWLIYPLSILFIFHTILVTFVHSTYMEQYLSTEGVGALFAIGSALAILAFLFFTHILRIVGNRNLTLILALIDATALVVLGFTEVKATAIVAFVTFITVNPLLFLNIDIFSETLIGNDESATGSKRGLILTLGSIAAAAAPLVMGFIAGHSHSDGLPSVYYAAAAVFVPFILIVLSKFRDFEDPAYPTHQVRGTLQKLWHVPDIRNVLFSHLTLQMFFAWATIYVPLYLATELGYTWDVIGTMMAVGIFAYVIFEYPIGIIADRWTGEKEMMALGFVILALSSSWISFMGVATVATWMLLLFITRFGASLVEATTESYFFKHTDGEDAEIISFFRLLRPLARLLGALFGAVAILYLPFNLIFIVLGLLMVPGIFSTLALKDTK